MSATEKTALAELDTLLADREITIGGQPVTVRAITLIDSLALHNDIGPLVSDLAELLTTERLLTLGEVSDVLARHYPSVITMVSRSVGRERAWVEALPGYDGQELLDVWWTVNVRFFVRAAQRVVVVGAAEAAMSGSAKSSRPSSRQATAKSGSDTTPKKS